MDDVTASIIIACQTAGAVNSINKLGFAMGMLGRKAIDFMSQSLQSFNAAQDASWKFGKTFRNSMGSATQAVKEFMEEYNLSEQTAKKMLADTASILKGFGFSEKDALKVSEQVSRMGIDLASFTGEAGGAQEAVDSITSALTGETERMKKYGTVIRMDDKALVSLTKTIQKNKNVSETQARSLAILQEIVKQNADAIGDYKAEGENWTQAQNDQKEAIIDLKDNLGGLLYEILDVYENTNKFTELIKKITKTIKENASEWVYYAKSFLNIWRSGFELIGRIVGTSFANVWKVISWFGENFNKMWKNSLDIAKAFFQDLAQIIRLPSVAIVKFFHSLGKGIASAIKAGFTGEKIGDAFTNEFASFSDFMIKQIANIGINTDRALAKAGVSQLTLTPVNFSKIFSDVEKGYRLRQQKIDSERNKKFLEPMDTPAAQSGYEPQARKLADKLVDNLPMFKSTSAQGIYANSIEAVRLQSRVATRSPEYELQQKQLSLLMQIRNSLNSLAGPTRTAVTTVRA